ncbi:hypothetical protein J2754_001589 [Halarchaeum solikamskense]|uniref:DNA cytosine methyltransferase n=1 Tax=Halarchaeum nitratireducens TaxID=489913 RepID=UPI001B3AB871|nr:DNA cytosine methyltransferase [Halarchaeum solikamskense]MBP2251268.1 hypothetical protein [Halarchaeum solikamskense]
MTRLAELYRAANNPDEVLVYDLYAGAGGVGLALETLDLAHVGFDIDGGKCEKYPGAFFEVDCSDSANIPEKLPSPDVVWASPPCKAYSTVSNINHDDPRDVYPTIANLDVREVINALDPEEYIIENVATCEDLKGPAKVNGLAFDAPYRLERHFETSFHVPNALAAGQPEQSMCVDNPTGRRKGPLADAKDVPRAWTREEVRSAIPQPYVQYLMYYCPAVDDVPLPASLETRQTLLVDSRTSAGDGDV